MYLKNSIKNIPKNTTKSLNHIINLPKATSKQSIKIFFKTLLSHYEHSKTPKIPNLIILSYIIIKYNPHWGINIFKLLVNSDLHLVWPILLL